MRFPILAAFCLPMALAACSSGEDAETEEGADGAGLTLGAGAQMRPGLYEARSTLLEFQMPDMPGMPAGSMDGLKSAMATEMEKAHTFCLTPEEARAGPQDMMKHLAESNCTMANFNVTANSMSGEMRCNDPEGMNGTVKVEGTFSGDSSTSTMEWSQTGPGLPGEGVRMKIRSESRRIGECPA